MCNFPNIEYLPDFPIMNNGYENNLPPSCQRVYTRLIHLHIVDDDFLEGIHNKIELENSILDLIDQYPENEADLERIFHLVHIWGGSAVRQFYNEHFIWADISLIYQTFIDVLRNIPILNEDNYINVCNIANEACLQFYHSLQNAGYQHLGVAFITKHAHFWMHRNNPDNMLPIYDSTFAINVTHEGGSASFRHLLHFWAAMYNQAQAVGVGLSALERQLFDYFQNNQEDVQVNENIIEELLLSIMVYNVSGRNFGRTFTIINRPHVGEATRVVIICDGNEYEARVRTYNDTNTLRGAGSIDRFIEEHHLQPGQIIQCGFVNENGTHKYLVNI